MLLGYPRSIIIGFILALGVALTLPHFAFGAARSLGKSAGALMLFGPPAKFVCTTFHTRFVGDEDVDDQNVIIVLGRTHAHHVDPRITERKLRGAALGGRRP